MPALSSSFRRLLLATCAGLLAVGALRADPLSKNLAVDFFRQVSSRDLHGLATRSDGRLVSGPIFTELTGAAPGQLLWCLEPVAADRWLIGTGPDGKIVEATIDAAHHSFTVRDVAKVEDAQVFALKRLANGDLLAGTSPKGQLVLVRDGKIIARAALPVDSIFDLLVAPGGRFVLVATGNPGRIYRVDLAKFAAGGLVPDKLKDAAALRARGITLFGEIRDRNVRRLARLADGRIAAGSSPKGNIYAFPAPAADAPSAKAPTPEATPAILDENHDAEVTDLLAEPDGGFLALLVADGGGNEFRVTPPKPKVAGDVPPPAQLEKFGGRGILARFPADGFPEVLVTRIGNAFYRLAREDDLVLIAGGEEGDFTGYDVSRRMALTFAGSTSARLTGLAPIPGSPRRFLALRNNAAGLALIDFDAPGAREAQTHLIDLGVPARIGAVRLDRLRQVEPARVQVEMRTSNGADELEGWSPWTALAAAEDGWRSDRLRGQYLKLRLHLPAEATRAEIERAAIYFLPQDRRPELSEFHFISPNYGLVPPAEPVPAIISTLSQLMSTKPEEKHKSGFLSSQVVPSTGAQVAFWTLADPDGDNLLATFSIRREGDEAWTDLAVDSRETYVQFDTSHLRDGVYFTRLVAKETAPRPLADRLSVTFETDNLVVDHTPPAILDASVRRTATAVVVTVHGRDALSLLQGVAFKFNNGSRDEVEQPVDGIRDGREETFALEERVSGTVGATAVEVILYDAAGNTTARTLPLPK